LFEKRLKYARVEAERRFLLAALPAEIDPATGYQTFEDLYFLGTTLRLRRVTSPDGAIVELKLNQKLPHDPPLPSHRVITSVYLTPDDFALLSQLGGARLVKRRYAFPWQGVRFGVDVFQEPLAGLVLAEAESSDRLDALPALPGDPLEVTEDPRFSGGSLAAEKPEKTLALARELLKR
jgi:CYTH domain-containing protein